MKNIKNCSIFGLYPKMQKVTKKITNKNNLPIKLDKLKNYSDKKYV